MIFPQPIFKTSSPLLRDKQIEFDFNRVLFMIYVAESKCSEKKIHSKVTSQSKTKIKGEESWYNLLEYKDLTLTLEDQFKHSVMDNIVLAKKILNAC